MAFMLTTQRDAMYGGAAGGGKSFGLLMAALQYVDEPDYDALILRQTYKHLSKPGALISLSHKWLGGTDAQWRGKDHRWDFPSGATLSFGYLEHDSHLTQWDGPSFQFIGWDELTQFPQHRFKYLFSRLRKSVGSKVPSRVRSACMPGGIGHDWVYNKYINPATREKGIAFIPALLGDNPGIDKEDYIKSLAHLTPLMRKRLLDGDWTATDSGLMFKANWFTQSILPKDLPKELRFCRYWDLASTRPHERNLDPDYTAGALMAQDRHGLTYFIDVSTIREDSAMVEKLVADTAEADRKQWGERISIVIEQEPGSSGKAVVDYYKRHVLLGYKVVPDPVSGKKHLRWNPFANRLADGYVYIVNKPNNASPDWLPRFVSQAEMLTDNPSDYPHDDDMDAAAGAHNTLIGYRKPSA